MHQLGALDANFFYTETQKVRNHIASVQQFRLPDEMSPLEFVQGLKIFLLNRVHLVPYLTHKIKFLPVAIDHPVWIADSAFDINNHVIETKLPSPGTHVQLEEKIAQLHSNPMDQSKPMWALYVITGLEDGSVVYYSQAHHACLDGMAGQAATMILMDNTPDHSIYEVPIPGSAEDTSLVSLFNISMQSLISYQVDTLSRSLGQISSAIKLTQRALNPYKSFGALIQPAPKTRFNKTIEAERSYACFALRLDQLKKLAKALDSKLNDVVLSICSGGLRSYLLRKGELPDTSLIAGCPVSIRKPDDKEMGNNVTMMSVALATQVSDPLVRHQEIKASANVAKAVTAEMSDGYYPNVSLPGLPGLIRFAASVTEATGLINIMPLPLNVVISNVPGPRQRLYSNGAEMLSHYPVSIPTHGIALNLTVQSYCDHLYFGITACKKALPDPAVLKADLESAFKELDLAVCPGTVHELVNQQPGEATESHGSGFADAAANQ